MGEETGSRSKFNSIRFCELCLKITTISIYHHTSTSYHKVITMKVSKLQTKITPKNLTAGNSHLPKVSACDVEQLLRNIDSKKSTGIEKIPPKLIEPSAKVLSKLLAIAINNGQIAFISPLDKYTDDKHFVTNFRPGSVLNTFSKIYEKSFLINKMEHHFSPFISTYHNSYSTEHVLTTLLDPLD